MKTYNKSIYIKVLLLSLIIALLFLAAYFIFGYGNININNMNEQTAIFVDNVYETSDKSKLKLRPGRHNVEISSPESRTIKQINISLFKTTTIDATENKWDYTKAVQSATDIYLEPIRIFEEKLFKDGWYSGILIAGNRRPEAFVIKFSLGKWSLLCGGYGNQNCDEYKIPEEVKAYFESLILIASSSRG